MARRLALFVIVALLSLPVLVLAFASCRASSASSAPKGNGTQSGSLTPEILSVERLSGGAKGASGVPQGIRITFTRLNLSTVAGYYVYRDKSPITVADPALRVTFSGAALVPQPPSGSQVTVIDLFEGSSLEIPMTYYYRVSALDTFDQEGDLSPEVTITTSLFDPGNPSPDSGYWGDLISVLGSNFGVYNPATDHAFFLTDGGEHIEAAIVGWDLDQINVTVPNWAITGRIRVVIAGTFADTDGVFNVLNPFLYGIVPAHGAEGDIIRLVGAHLNPPTDNKWVFFPGFAQCPPEDILLWTDTYVELRTPVGSRVGDAYVYLNGDSTNPAFFRAHPRLDSSDYPGGMPGQNLTIDGLNFSGLRGSSRVIFPGGKDGTGYPGWNDHTVMVAIPDGVQTGDIVMQVAGNYSNSLHFDLWTSLTASLTVPAPGNVFRGPFQFAVVTEPTVEGVRWYVTPYGEPDATPIFVSTQFPFDYAGDTYALSGIRNGHYDVTAQVVRRNEIVNVTADAWIISLRGDLNADGIVNDLDMDVVWSDFGLRQGVDAGYNPVHDADGNGVIDETDVSIIGYSFLDTGP